MRSTTSSQKLERFYVNVSPGGGLLGTNTISERQRAIFKWYTEQRSRLNTRILFKFCVENYRKKEWSDSAWSEYFRTVILRSLQSGFYLSQAAIGEQCVIYYLSEERIYENDVVFLFWMLYMKLYRVNLYGTNMENINETHLSRYRR